MEWEKPILYPLTPFPSMNKQIMQHLKNGENKFKLHYSRQDYEYDQQAKLEFLIDLFELTY